MSEAVTAPSVMTMNSIISEESIIAKDRQTHIHIHNLVLVYVNLLKSLRLCDVRL